MDDRVTLRVDPHVHSDGSYDGHEPVELLLEHASDIGLDAIVVTDHDAIEESLRAARLAPDYGLVGIPGVEVSTRHGHLLAVGVTERPPKGESFADTAAAIRELGGAAVVPHPFQRSRHGVRKRYLDDTDVDAVEVYNSMLFTGYRNRRARRYARNRNYPGMGSSDAHHVMNVGRAYTELDVNAPTKAAADASDVVEAIRTGSTGVRGHRTPIHRSARQYAMGAVKKGLFEVTSRTPLVPTVPSSYAQQF
ncbi:CehA/McbA family metallohydrolase [Salarchaeum sp. III]|uniref:CehA/McbA family metallohydrolase n=1 Tax=Salarchaeum sp. III TaxID=3107927 RepID=UPI002ED86785